MATFGVLLCSWGKVGYGYSAFNLAASIKFRSPQIPITLITDATAISHLNEQYKAVFDNIIVMGEPITDPGLFKVGIYDRLPYDYTLYMDVDALCINDISPLFEKLISDYQELPEINFYRTHVHGWYDKESPVDMPLMYWARRDVIWDQYSFNDEKLPATQSSIQFIAKSERAEKFYRDLKHLMTYNYIPLEALTHKWGGTQPDELYLNIQIAKDGLKPDIENSMWFCDNANKYPHEIQKEGYYFLSYFGVMQKNTSKGGIKIRFTEYYDKELIILLRKMGFANHLWKSHHTFNGKHAGNKVTVKQQAAPQNTALQKKAESEFFTPHRYRSIHLFTTYYKCGSEKRQAELLDCIKRNLENPYITKVFLLSEIDVPLTDDKLTIYNGSRPTMAALVQYANNYPGEINIMANSDIYTDSTIGMCCDFYLTGKVLCLSRWETSGRHYDYEYSQDTWIWEGKLNLQGGDYHFGLLGCDNKFAHDLFTSGYVLLNPSRHIRTHHLHNTNERNYSEKTRLPRPYRHVPVGGIEELKPKRLLLHQPGKVGDMIICLPIAKHYSDLGYEVEWLAPAQYHLPGIKYVKFVTGSAGNYDKVIDLSFGLITTTPIHALWMRRKKELDSFVTLKYELAGVPIEKLRQLEYERNHEKENKLFDLLVTDSVFALTHTASDYGNPVTVDSNLTHIEFKPVEGFSILDWRKIIESATEIHCIDSSLCNLVDCLDVKAELFYYPSDKCPMKADETILTKKWNRVNELQHA